MGQILVKEGSMMAQVQSPFDMGLRGHRSNNSNNSPIEHIVHTPPSSQERLFPSTYSIAERSMSDRPSGYKRRGHELPMKTS